MSLQPFTLAKRYSAWDHSTRLQAHDPRAVAGTAKSMKTSPTLRSDMRQAHVELERVQAFLAVVLAERAGPLTRIQRDLLQSAATAINRLERRKSDTNERSF